MNHELFAILRGQEVTSRWHFPDLKIKLPLPEKIVKIRCAWTNGCRRRSRPQTSNQSVATLSNKYMGWIMSFLPSSEDKNSPQGVTFQVWLMQPPLPAICLFHWLKGLWAILWVNIDGWMQPGDLMQVRRRGWLLKLPHQNSSKVQVCMAFWKKLELSKMEKWKVRVRQFSEKLEFMKFKLANFFKTKS